MSKPSLIKSLDVCKIDPLFMAIVKILQKAIGTDKGKGNIAQVGCVWQQYKNT